MKNKSGLSLAMVCALAFDLFGVNGTPYRVALPGYRYEFPRDHFNHPDFQTEWWYYTGNLHTAQGRRFGFDLTFFRQGVDRDMQPATARDAHPANVWDVKDVWMAHLALSDIDGGRFFHTERLNRAAGGIAGADLERGSVWNGNWQASWQLDRHASGGVASQRLEAVADQFSLDLALRSAKPPVIHGKDGVSQKAEGAGHASHYISLTRLVTKGVITLDGTKFDVEGLSWMDHEFFTHQLEPAQSGWDWMSLQFDDGSEIMLFRLRRKDGAVDPYSAGTYIDAQGRASPLAVSDFSLAPGKTWISPASGGRYPIEWTIRVFPLDLELSLSTRLPQQELTGKTRAAPPYWEGAIECSGARKDRPVKAVGYLEMTGYAGAAPLAE